MGAEKIRATVLFADVCRSTWMYRMLGDERAAGLIETALGAAAACVSSNGGTVLRSKGDDILCLFTDAGDAFRAALAIHRLARDHPDFSAAGLEMRIGINSGSVLLSGEEVAGDSVNVAARLCDLSKGGQTVISAASLDEDDTVPPGMLRSLGNVQLKGVSSPLALFELLDELENDEITAVAPLTPQPSTSNRLAMRFRGEDFRMDFRLVRFLLGRSPDCDLVIDHPLVSRHHAEIRFAGHEFVLVDFSTNGTLIQRSGQRRIVHRAQVALRGRGLLFPGRAVYNRELEIAFHASGAQHGLNRPT